MNRLSPAALLFHLMFLVFMLAPLVVVVLVAFTPEGYISFPVHGVSLRWFRAILDRPSFIDSFYLSLELGLASSAIATVLMLPTALAVGRFRFPGRGAMLALAMSPLMIPPVVLGVALLRFFTMFQIQGTFSAVLLAHVVVVMPFVLRMLLAGVAGLDPWVERAAVSLGATAFTAFRRVTLPMLAAGLVGGFILAFTASFDELTVTIFVSSPQVTPLSVRLFNHIAETTDPLVASVSVVIIVITTMLLILLDRLYGVDRLFGGAR
jgi:putative spermidine/putrescine transport system permease protein